MTPLSAFCPGGLNSQTGTAALERYTDIELTDCGDIAGIPERMKMEQGTYVFPVWNSHQGEIAAACHFWDRIESELITITDLWPKRIEFCWLRKKRQDGPHGKIGSVIVAETQCSNFLSERGFTLEKYKLTTLALQAYEAGAKLDGVLVVPKQYDEQYEVVQLRTANDHNFTSFVAVKPVSGMLQDEGNSKTWITGVKMAAFRESLGESEQSFFNQLFSSARNIDDLPRLMFVIQRTANVGLLFEGLKLKAADLLDAEEIDQGRVSVYENAGLIDRKYSMELENLFDAEFPSLLSSDFIVHRGVKTCLFACPTLGVFTHGYEVDAVEPVVRFLIGSLFNLIESGINCSEGQKQFFERFREVWLEQGSNFIQFSEI